MSRAAFAWLGGAAMALGAIIAAELAGHSPPPPIAAAAIPASPRGAVAAEPAAGSDQSRLAAILGRPLFDPSRRPPRPSGPSEARALRLSGTIVAPGAGPGTGPDEREAIFEPAGGGRPVVVREGQRVGSAVVRSIAPGVVLVVGAGGPRLLEPSYSLSAVEAGTGTPPLVPHLPGMAARLQEAK
jgi:general secretion pathway protein N